MYEFLHYRAGDAMTRSPAVLEPHVSVRDAQHLFEEHDFNGVPVMDDGRLVGFLTKLDLLAAFAFVPAAIVPAYETIMRQPIAGIMTREPLTVSPDLPLTRVLALMLQTRNKSFPVVDRGRLVGIIAREDVLRALRQASHDREAAARRASTEPARHT